MVSADLIFQYFPNLDELQKNRISKLFEIYSALNEKVNLVSRKDMDNFYIHHVLHSLALVKNCEFPAGKKILDIGTGGGFPGIPLAIFFPETQFVLCDSITKKIRAVQEVIDILELDNASALNSRTENLRTHFHAIVARAVAPASELWQWSKNLWENEPRMYLLKGGDLNAEISDLLAIAPKLKVQQIQIAEYFSEAFFETKKVVKITR